MPAWEISDPEIEIQRWFVEVGCKDSVDSP